MILCERFIILAMLLRLTISISIVLTMLCTAEMLCLLPGVQLKLSEMECCRRMAGDCDRMPLPNSHSCCKNIARHDTAIVAKTELPSPIAGAVDFPVEPAAATHVIPMGSKEVSADLPPPGSPLVSNTILRI
jgi:hypothetical protein